MESYGQKQNRADVISLFDEFYNHYLSVCSDLTCKEESLKLITAQKSKLSETNSKLRDEHSTLQTTVNECQTQLHLVCGLQDEIRSLKKILADKEESLHEETRQWKKSMQDLQNEMASSLEEQKITLTNSYQVQIDKLNETICNLEDNKTSLEKQLHTLSKEKTAEINSLMMSYEGKLNKANRQNTLCKQQQQMVVSQDILRKKMQHMKASYERDTASLKSKIADLEQTNENIRQELDDKTSGVNSNGILCQQGAKSPQQDNHLSINRKRWWGKDWSLSLSK